MAKRTKDCEVEPPALTSASLINSDISIPFSFVYDRLFVLKRASSVEDYTVVVFSMVCRSGIFNYNLKLCFFTFFPDGTTVLAFLSRRESGL